VISHWCTDHLASCASCVCKIIHRDSSRCHQERDWCALCHSMTLACSNTVISKSCDFPSWPSCHSYVPCTYNYLHPSPFQTLLNFHSKSPFEFNEVNWIQIHWTKSSLFWNSNPCLEFQKCPWANDLNLNPTTKNPHAYFGMVYTFLNLESPLSQKLCLEFKCPLISIKSLDSNFISKSNWLSISESSSKPSY
jgi:hypothetical protein